MQKCEILLEFAEWLYYNNFPLTEAQLQTQSAIDILLSTGVEASQSDSNQVDPTILTHADVIFGKCVSVCI